MKVSSKIAELKKRYNELTVWISENTNHPTWMEVVSERNAISVQLEVLKQQERGMWKPTHQVPSYTIVITQK